MSFTAGSSGGKYKHKLTVSEMASHRHDTPVPQNLASVTTTDRGYGAMKVENPRIGGNAGYYTSLVGGNQSHNNIQPYTVIYYWKRTA